MHAPPLPKIRLLALGASRPQQPLIHGTFASSGLSISCGCQAAGARSGDLPNS